MDQKVRTQCLNKDNNLTIVNYTRFSSVKLQQMFKQSQSILQDLNIEITRYVTNVHSRILVFYFLFGFNLHKFCNWYC